MTIRELEPDIKNIGAIDWDRRLFDMLVPLPHGTSYNSYLVKGSEKTALIDTAYLPKKEEFLKNLEKANVKKLDYIISNHAEQDHSGAIPLLLEKYPEAKVVTNAKSKDLLMAFYDLSDDVFIIVDDSSKIFLGNKTLSFILAPWVHWPDTMFTYIEEDKIIFTCDFLGSHLATSDTFVQDESLVINSAKRYFAEIMMPFRSHIRKHLEKLDNLNIEIIAPSHGPVYDKPEFILDLYKEWASEDPKNMVLIPYVSMYESTGKMIQYLADGLIEKGIKVQIYNLAEMDLGEFAAALVDSATIVFGASLVLMNPHPLAIYAAAIVNALRPKTKFITAVGSYGWAAPIGEKMDEQFRAMIPNLKPQALTPVFTKGMPTTETYKKLDVLIEEIYQKHKLL